jgi:hypothetical protein
MRKSCSVKVVAGLGARGDFHQAEDQPQLHS